MFCELRCSFLGVQAILQRIGYRFAVIVFFHAIFNFLFFLQRYFKLKKQTSNFLSLYLEPLFLYLKISVLLVKPCKLNEIS